MRASIVSSETGIQHVFEPESKQEEMYMINFISAISGSDLRQITSIEKVYNVLDGFYGWRIGIGTKK